MRLFGKPGGTRAQFRGAWLTTPFDLAYMLKMPSNPAGVSVAKTGLDSASVGKSGLDSASINAAGLAGTTITRVT